MRNPVLSRFMPALALASALGAVAPVAWAQGAATERAPVAAAAEAVGPKRLALTAEQRRRASISILQNHGIDLVDPGKPASGVRIGATARPTEALAALRVLDLPGSGPTQLFKRTMPTQSDPDTEKALRALQDQRAEAALTAGAALFNEMGRKLASGRCSEASARLDREEIQLRSAGDPSLVPGSKAYWEALERTNPAVTASYRAASLDYRKVCLDDRIETLTDSQRSALGQVLGVLQVDGVPVCMATRIRADLVMTARHCLFTYDASLGWRRQKVKSVTFALVDRPKLPLRLKLLDCAAASTAPGCESPAADPTAADHLVLAIVPPPNGSAAVLPPMPDLSYESPRRGQFLVVPGYSTWFMGRAWSEDDRPFATAPAIGGCLVTSVQNGCVFNACQSDAGFSGTPIFARRNTDRLVVVGIFLGAATAYPSCQETGHNFGAPLPAFMTPEKIARIGRTG